MCFYYCHKPNSRDHICVINVAYAAGIVLRLEAFIEVLGSKGAAGSVFLLPCEEMRSNYVRRKRRGRRNLSSCAWKSTRVTFEFPLYHAAIIYGSMYIFRIMSCRCSCSVARSTANSSLCTHKVFILLRVLRVIETNPIGTTLIISS